MQPCSHTTRLKEPLRHRRPPPHAHFSSPHHGSSQRVVYTSSPLCSPRQHIHYTWSLLPHLPLAPICLLSPLPLVKFTTSQPRACLRSFITHRTAHTRLLPSPSNPEETKYRCGKRKKTPTERTAGADFQTDILHKFPDAGRRQSMLTNRTEQKVLQRRWEPMSRLEPRRGSRRIRVDQAQAVPLGLSYTWITPGASECQTVIWKIEAGHFQKAPR